MITHEISQENFWKQIQFSIDGYKNHGINYSDIDNVIIGGLGGSGIGGRIARTLFMEKFKIPVEVYNEYFLPGYANNRTLVVLSSYSGQTEETLSMLSLAKERGCKIIVIASGGKLLDFSKTNNLPYYVVESGYQPRMALGYSLTTLLLILAEISKSNIQSDLEVAIDILKKNQTIKDEAKIAFNLFRSTANQKFVVVADVFYEAVGIRFCQQIQENAKGESFVNVLPEANHNVIESYYEHRDTNFIFLDSGKNSRTTARFNFVLNQLKEHQNTIYQLKTGGFGVPQVFSTIHQLDWLSVWISNEKGVNNMEVGIITKLKLFLDSI